MGNKLYKIENFLLDTRRRELFSGNQSVHLSSRAFDILLHLIENNGRVVEKNELLDKVWTDSFVEEGNLAVHISAIRRVLQEKKGESKFIKTVSGRGYSFVAKVQEMALLQNQHQENNFKKSEQSVSNASFSLAVLPFTFDDKKEDNEYLENGITQSLINDLSEISNLKVLSFSAVKKYRNVELDLQEIGFLLDANKILTGRIFELQGKLEIVVELINAYDGSLIWGTEQIFDSDDIFKAKKEISLTLAKKLKLKFGNNLSLQKEIYVEAQKLYYRGKFILESRTTQKNPEKVLRQALKFFKQAVVTEPNYALAHTGIGSVYVSLHNYNLLEREKAYTKAVEALETALKTNSDLSEAYVLKGSIEIMFEKKFCQALDSLDIAIKLNPNNPDAYHWKGFICTSLKKFEEALDLETKATQFDPTSLRFNEQLIRIFYFSGDFNKTIIQAEEILAFDNNSLTSYFFLALSYAELKQFDKALENAKKLIELRSASVTLLLKAYILSLSGSKIEAKKMLQDVLDIYPTHQTDFYTAALVFLSLNNFDQTFNYLDKAYEESSTALNFIKADIRFKKLRNDQRFKNLLQKMNLL